MLGLVSDFPTGGILRGLSQTMKGPRPAQAWPRGGGGEEGGWRARGWEGGSGLNSKLWRQIIQNPEK